VAEELPSELLRYLADCDHSPDNRLPALKELAQQMGISIGKLREQLEVARAMGLVDVRPKTGIRLRSYTFAPCLEISLQFALAINPAYFNDYSILRNHVESAFWDAAVRLLTVEDKKHLQELIDKAWAKLHFGLIPHEEHRDLH
jgi:DNA-binding FadR family transcriptional regulator